ncbi:hypothetical protein DFH08DRAFT_787882 [Mycena albidolilacea]|uniref:Transmembrane protein n=1 Tax=Mycena albidolilacea TaxID=1033008 RepID=A0AAD6ZHY5_9AGAR|nr:hypothetical protein DFH08DRAFT_787882 [Mycena albidolilacea]
MSGRRHGVSWPLSLIYLFAASSSTLATRSLNGRSAQTQARCSTDYDWATNSQLSSPCLLTAYVWGSCFTGSWDIPQLTPNQSYTNPNSSTANLCTCSWAAYNLISACTACQGFDSAVENWAAYDQSCNGFLTDSYFPSNVTLPTGTAIPFWAATDPRSWNNGRFDTAQAKLVAQQNKPDLVQGRKKSKPPVGAIVGGVIGGVAVLIIGGVIAFLFIRKRKPEQTNEGDTHPYLTRPPHGRSVSDLSGKSILIPRSLSMANSQRPGTIYTTNTIHTQTGSVHSLTYGSGFTSPARAMSPPLPVQVSNREDVIEPFTLRSTSPPVSMRGPMTRKTSETTLSTEPPAAMVVQERYVPDTGDRARRNPPAYSPYPSPASSPEPVDPTPSSPRGDFAPGHRTRREKASVDTQQSYDSSPSHNGGESISAIDDVIGRMGLTMAPESVVGSTMGAQTVSTGQSANVVSRPTHKPNVSNPDNDSTLGRG